MLSAAEPPLFEGWTKPKLMLFFTGFLDGYIEPCGCAGLDQMKGGLSRRMTCLQQLEKNGWHVLPIDAGNLNKGFGQQEELKFNFVIDEAYRLMKYQAAGLGSRELLFPTDTLILYSVDVPGNPKRYTSANAAIMEFSPDFVVPYRILEKEGIKIGIVSVLGDSLRNKIHNDDIKTAAAAGKLKEVLPKIAAENCNKKVLIFHGTANELNMLLKEFPDRFDFVLPSDIPAEPPLQPRKIGKTVLIEVGEKGRYAVAAGLFDDEKMPIRFERIPFDSRYNNSPKIMELMKIYQDQLRQTGLSGLGIKPIPDKRSAILGSFAGSASCADCHETAHNIWKKSRHAKAWDSLKETAKPARNFDPECIACHVIGWNAAEFMPYQNGFRSEKETPKLVSVGCESCHGQGENHIKAEQGADTALQEKIRRQLRLSVEGETVKKHCLTCHDGNNSPHFDFDTYWKKIDHRETEKDAE